MLMVGSVRQGLHTQGKQGDDGDVDTFCDDNVQRTYDDFSEAQKKTAKDEYVDAGDDNLNILIVVVGVTTHVIGFDSPVMAQILEQNSSSGHPVNSLADGLI